jgi:hypothetical protein
VGLAYAGQVIPLGWRVVKGKKGHTDPELQTALLTEIRALLPTGQVVLVADSEFCAVELLRPLQDWGWQFIVRVRGNVTIQPSQAQALQLSSVPLREGQTHVWPEILWTVKHSCGPLWAIATWQAGEPEPLYVLTNTRNAQAALLVYDWRFWIEPLFGDYKGRGFRLGLSRVRDPERLSRLLLAASIALVWALAVGGQVFQSAQQRLVDRGDRSDRSLFQLGYRFLKHCWKLTTQVEVSFHINPSWFPVPLTLDQPT